MRFFAKNAFFRKKGAYITSGWLNGPIFVFLLETDFFWKIYPTMMQKTVGILKKYTSFDFLAPFDVFVVPPPKGAFTNKKTKKCCFWPRFGSIMHIEFWFFLRNGNCFRNFVRRTLRKKQVYVENNFVSPHMHPLAKNSIFLPVFQKREKTCFFRKKSDISPVNEYVRPEIFFSSTKASFSSWVHPTGLLKQLPFRKKNQN